MRNRGSLKAFAIAGAVLFTLIVLPVSYILLMYGFSYEPEPSQELAMATLVAINLPAVILLAFSEDFTPSSGSLFDVLVLIMFPLNGAFWGCMCWLVRKAWHNRKQNR